MRKTGLIIFFLAIVKLFVQLIGNRNYGFHRDELLHLSVSEHLEWGFMEFPPLIGFIGRLSDVIFDYSLMGTRLFPSLAGVAILVLCCLITKELNGSRHAIFLAGICNLSFLPFYRNHTLFQPVAFDQLFWTLGFYHLIRYINTKDSRYLLYTSGAFGLGLLNKYTILVWGFGVFIGMLFFEKGSVFRNKWWYISGIVSTLIFLPNVIWQINNNLPIIRHLEGLDESQLSQLDVMQFGVDQLDYPLTLIVSIIGLIYLLGRSDYKSIGISVIVIFSSMWILQSKSYYIFAIYPVLFAAGSVKIANCIKHTHVAWNYVLAIILLVPAIIFIPHLTPVLAIDDYVDYAELRQEEGRYELQGDYADMFGWEEQVRLVDSIYQSLEEDERNNCVLWAENYGEAGALKILGKKYDLPNPVSRHGSFWKWGYANDNADVWISLGNEIESVENVFEEFELVKVIYHPYAIDEENGIPVYICRKPNRDIKKWWSDYEPYIFN